MLSNKLATTPIMFNTTQGYGAKIEWSATQNIAGNFSTINGFKVYLSTYNSKINVGGRTVTVKIAGNTRTFSVSGVNSTAANTTADHLVYTSTETFKINHDNSGKGQFDIYMSYPINITASWSDSSGSHSKTIGTSVLSNTTQVLNDIPRGPTINSAVEINNVINVEYTPKVSTYYNQLKIVAGNTTLSTINLGSGTENVQKTASYTLTTANITTIVNSVTTSPIAKIKITILAYADSGYSNLIAETPVTEISYAIGNEYRPLITKITVTNTVANPTAIGNSYIQRKSKLNIVVDATGKNSASIVNYRAMVNGVNYDNQTNTITTDTLLQSGTVRVNVVVTDSRGLTSAGASDYIDIIVEPYNDPRVTSFSLIQVADNGEEDDDGELLEITFGYSISPISNKNVKNIYLQRYSTISQAWETCVNIAQEEYSVYKTMVITNYYLSSGTSNKFRLIAQDSFSSSNPFEFDLPESTAVYDIEPDSDCITFGGKQTKKDIFEFKKPVAIRGAENLLVSNENDESTVSFMSLLSSLDSKFKVINTTTPSSTSAALVYSDTTLKGHYMIVGYTVEHSGDHYAWYGDTMNGIFISSAGLNIQIKNSVIANKPIHILLFKYA